VTTNKESWLEDDVDNIFGCDYPEEGGMVNREAAVLAIDGAAGIYAPQEFIKAYGRDLDPGTADEEAVATLEVGPEAEWYWEAWDDVESYGTVNGGWRIYQDGDVWLVHPDAEWDDDEGWFRLPGTPPKSFTGYPHTIMVRRNASGTYSIPGAAVLEDTVAAAAGLDTEGYTLRDSGELIGWGFWDRLYVATCDKLPTLYYFAGDAS